MWVYERIKSAQEEGGGEGGKAENILKEGILEVQIW